MTLTSGVKEEPVIVTGVPTAPDDGESVMVADVRFGVTVKRT